MEDAVARTLSQRRRRRLGRLRPAGVVSALILHLALVALAILVPIFSAEESQALEIVNVRIVPSQALGTPQPPQPEPEPAEPVVEEEPEPEPEPEETPPEEEPPPPEPEPERPVMPVPTEDAEPKETPPQRAEPEPAPAPPPAAADRPGSATGRPTGTSATGTNISAVGDPDFTYGYYLDRVLAAIEANWRRPPTDGVELQVVVNFRIRRDGRVFELDVAEESGLGSFDLAGLRAVQASSPLPPLPAGYRKDSLAIRLIIR